MLVRIFIVDEPCGLGYGYVIKINDQDETKTNKTQISLPEYSRKTVKFSVESYIGKERSKKVETSLELCSFDDPEKPILGSNHDKNVVSDGKYKFSWKNSAQNKEEVCGIKMEYTYGVSVTLVDKPDVFENVTNTSAIRDVQSGRYNWKVVISNGISISNVSSAVMWFCVPKNIP